MLIVSKTHDYYDPVGKSKGVDKTIVYRRAEEEIKDEKTKKVVREFNLFSYTDTRYSFRRNNALQGVNMSMAIIGFCGKFFPVMKYAWQNPKSVSYSPEVQFIYDLAKIQGLIKLARERVYFPRNVSYDELVRSPALKTFYESFRCPVVQFGVFDHYESNIVILNPILKDIDFMKVVDPYTAFQEIEMYISGFLGAPPKPMVSISDKDRLLAHGFDAKTSFRKPKKERRK
jgi:hypothetical protein